MLSGITRSSRPWMTRAVRQGTDVGLGAGQGFSPALAQGGYGGERFLKAGADAGLKAQARQVVAHQALVEAK